MKRLALVMVAMVALLLAMLTAARAATTVEINQIREAGAAAQWQYFDTAGNETFVTVITSALAVHPDSSESPAPILVIEIFRSMRTGL